MSNSLSRFAFAVVALSAVACSKPKLDDTKLDEALRSGLKGAKIEVKTLTCPKGMEQRAGNDFDCQGETTEGTKFVVKVSQPDDSGNVKWKSEAAPEAPKP